MVLFRPTSRVTKTGTEIGHDYFVPDSSYIIVQFHFILRKFCSKQYR